MRNSENYRFSDFTFGNYRKLLKIAKKHYTFLSFENAEQCEKYIIWRHDVDYSIYNSCKLSNIESEEGVRAIYFLRLHSEFYNILERKVADFVRNIIALGHDIGLHFECDYYGIKEVNDLHKYLLIEKRILEEMFDLEIKVFSFHNPNEFSMSCKDLQYANIINANANTFMESVGYCSDSNGYWRFQRLEDFLQQRHEKRLHVLTHPVWWNSNIMSPKERIWNCIEKEANKNKNFYMDLLRNYKRLNIDW